MSDVERYEMLRHCRYVDEIITEAPWVLTREFMDKHKVRIPPVVFQKESWADLSIKKIILF